MGEDEELDGIRAGIPIPAAAARDASIPEPPFDETEGTWESFDVFVGADGTVEPASVKHDDCERGIVLYAVQVVRAPNCGAADKARALAAAEAAALVYFRNNFECVNKHCPAKRGKKLWEGRSCCTAPDIATAAVLYRFFCEVEL
ncbi:MAG: hypothetical protein AAF371_04670 [Pseudomonadota bacterium]